VYDAARFATTIVYRAADAADGARAELSLTLRRDAAPSLRDPLGGDRPAVIAVVRDPKTQRVTLTLPLRAAPLVLDLNDGLANAVSERSEVTGQAQLSVGEILARHQQARAAEDRLLAAHIVRARMDQHFRPTSTDPGFDVVTDNRFFADREAGRYDFHQEPAHILMKVETHNHPTAISPWPGAATGSGGEIRDEGATGRGAKPKAGLVGFSVSNLRIPGFEQPWEEDFGKPERIVTALDIMTEGPLGGAAFNNEFGRPALNGYFRTYEEKVDSHNGEELRGYHKPIMLAGGIGNIRADHVQKGEIVVGAKLIVLGGPAMNIGLGGGAASSMASGQSDADLDFASVQRDNPEMERRCQEVIDRCWQLGDANPILFIHDVGAGGLSNAMPELVSDGGRGGRFNLRDILSDEPGMSPLEIWCNESQERYVLAVAADQLPLFDELCRRERAPYAVIGEATEEQHLSLSDTHFDNQPIDLPLDVLLGKTPKMTAT